MTDNTLQDSGIVALDHLRALHVTGKGAAAWLDRLLSCPVTALAAGEARLGCWCNIKGRVVAVVLVVRHTEHVDLILHTSLAAAVAGELRRYILREALAIAEDPVPPAGIRLAGDGPEQGVALPWDRRRAIAWRPAASDDTALRDWRCADIAAGVVWLSAPLSGRYLPQMLGLEAFGAVDFGKGCYPGQEIIARTHHLGRVKKSAFRFTMQGSDPPPPGVAIVEADGEPCGTVIEACRCGDDLIHGIAVIDLPAAERRLVCEIAGQRLSLTIAG